MLFQNSMEFPFTLDFSDTYKRSPLGIFFYLLFYDYLIIHEYGKEILVQSFQIFDGKIRVYLRFRYKLLNVAKLQCLGSNKHE